MNCGAPEVLTPRLIPVSAMMETPIHKRNRNEEPYLLNYLPFVCVGGYTQCIYFFFVFTLLQFEITSDKHTNPFEYNANKVYHTLHFHSILHIKYHCASRTCNCNPQTHHLLKLFLGTKLIGVSALLLSTVGSSWWKSSVTLTADSLLAIELLSQKSKGRIVNSSTKTKNKVKGGLLLDVVVGEGTSVLELLSCEDQTLLIRGNSLLILNLGLYIIDGVGRLNIKGDGLPGEGLNKDLHILLLGWTE